jgi:hypothetical protein
LIKQWHVVRSSLQRVLTAHCVMTVVSTTPLESCRGTFRSSFWAQDRDTSSSFRPGNAMSWQLQVKKKQEPKRPGQASGSGEPALKHAKVGDVLAITNAAGKKKEEAKVQQQQQQQQQQQHQQHLSIALKLIDQLESRLREVEGVLFDTIRLAATDSRVQAAREALKSYAQAVAEHGPGHDHGPPHVHLFAAVLGAVSTEEVVEESIATRAFSLRMLRASLLQQDLRDVTSWVKSFKIADLYQKQGESLMTRMQLCLKGSVRIPPATTMKELIQEAAAAEVAGAAALSSLAAEVVGDFVEGVPTPADGPRARGKVVQVQALLTSYLCASGGTKYAGRAPRGGLAYRLHKSIKGKGKGSMEDDDV